MITLAQSALPRLKNLAIAIIFTLVPIGSIVSYLWNIDLQETVALGIDVLLTSYWYLQL